MNKRLTLVQPRDDQVTMQVVYVSRGLGYEKLTVANIEPAKKMHKRCLRKYSHDIAVQDSTARLNCRANRHTTGAHTSPNSESVCPRMKFDALNWDFSTQQASHDHALGCILAAAAADRLQCAH